MWSMLVMCRFGQVETEVGVVVVVVVVADFVCGDLNLCESVR